VCPDRKIERFHGCVSVAVILAYTGLRTSVGLLDSRSCGHGLIILVAVVGKFTGGSVPARLTGMTWRDSWALGALMNTRGLMELVLLNIALDIGLITPTLFTMLVIMALTTTFMTAPLLEWIYFRVLGHEQYVPSAQVLPPDEEEYIPVDRKHSFGIQFLSTRGLIEVE
jgi:Kef-type K+ transport system membrane component KefB